MTQYSPAWAHGEIKEIFSNIFIVMGTNITIHEGTELQHSCNMVIVKNANELTLINTVRLNDKGLAILDNLGQVTNVVRIGEFHGRHDAFYIDRYLAKFWALKDINDENKKCTDIELTPNGKMPFPDCSLFVFETSVHPEGILHINRESGIIITCDSVKNPFRRTSQRIDLCEMNQDFQEPQAGFQPPRAPAQLHGAQRIFR